ncbi:MAG: hypothetical protein K6E29_03160 [Cyanobacteria bacterium RUI128]|nr:hypothetical protein [Cyanobacteria bacterium RUI128]
MAKRVDTATKTTRNKEFNSYFEIINSSNSIYHTVLSTTANTKKIIQNIKLHDVGEAIVKKGSEIADDALNNTAMIETLYGFDTKSAKILAYYAVNGEPDPYDDPEGYVAYKKLEEMLEANGTSFEKIKTMVIDYYKTDDNPEGIFDDDTKDNPYYIFGAPEQVVLNNRQHYNNCGIESTLNLLAMAGYIKMSENLKDQSKVEKNFLKTNLERNLASDAGELGVMDESDGGTLPDDYRDIMAYYGISSKSYYITDKADEYVYDAAKINEFAYKISQGCGAVVGVCSDVLWNEAQSETESGEKHIDHAIAVLGVVYDTATPYDAEHGTYKTPIGFYIQDTGAWMTRFISYADFIDATLCEYKYGETSEVDKTLDTLKEWDSRKNAFITKDTEGIFVTLTDNPIKNEMFNLNATGDKYANTIWGNSGNNVIKGMKGNDTLYGGAGNDTIYGGAGDDIVVGNRAYKIDVSLDGDPFKFDSISDDFEAYLKKAGAMSDRDDDPLKARLKTIERQTITGDYDDLTELYDAVKEGLPNGINTLYGEAGNDIIIGGEEADLVYGGKGNDYVYAGDGRNAVYAGAGNDVLVGGYDNDKLFGDAGNDYIFGLEDDDTIDGGAGNDHIWGGSGDDRIEAGAGNDNIYFEGYNFGTDEVTAKAGKTTFNFVDGTLESASKVTDFFFSLDKQEDNNGIMDLTIGYTQEDLEDGDTGINFQNFCTSKYTKAKSLALHDEDGDYKFALSTKSAVAATQNVNNVLLTTYTKGTNITTSNKNDVVTMIGVDTDMDNTYNDQNIADKITYTGGHDKYVSEERNTKYVVNSLDDATNLSIYDNITGLTKWTNYDQYITDLQDPTKGAEFVEGHMNLYRTENGVSTKDSLYVNNIENKNSFHFFFDVAKEGGTVQSNGLYILDSTGAKYTSVAAGDDVSGLIYMDSFFGNSESGFGNGMIEHLYYKNEMEYENFSGDINTIKANVASWLSNYNDNHGTDYDCIFEALQGDVSGEDLITLYNVPAA